MLDDAVIISFREKYGILSTRSVRTLLKEKNLILKDRLVVTTPEDHYRC